MRTLTPETTTAALWRPSVRAFARRCAARVLLRVTLAELVDAAAGIHDLVLARVERVRGRRHVDLDQRVLVAVFPLDRLLAAKGRAGQELEIGSHVLEHDFFVFGVDVGLHGCTGSAVDKSGIFDRKEARQNSSHYSTT